MLTCSVVAIDACFGMVSAQTTNWIGATGNWSNTTNWSLGTVPTSSNDVNVTNGGTAQITSASNAQSLTISGGSAIDLQSAGSLTVPEIVLGDTGTTTGTIMVAASQFPNVGTIQLNAGGGVIDTYGAAGSASSTGAIIEGSGGLTKTGAGTLQLTNAGGNIYTGATTVAAGTLQAGAPLALSPASSVTVNAGATLDLNSYDQNLVGIAGAGSITLGSATLEVSNANGSTNFSGTISGTGRLTKYGVNTLTLSGTNSYSGETFVTGGTLEAGAVNAFSPNSQHFVGSGATLDLNNFNQTIGSLTDGGLGGGTVTLGSATLTTGGDNTSTTFAGTISGTGSLTKVGSGTFKLSGANTYQGATTVSGGVLQAGAANVIPSNSDVTVNSGATFDLNGYRQTIGSLSGSGTVGLESATLLTGGDNASTTFTGTIAGTGTLVKTGTGTLSLFGANSYSGGTYLGQGTIAILTDSGLGNGGTLTMTNQTTLAIDAPGSYSHNVGLAGVATFDVASATNGAGASWNGLISGGGTLFVTGGGTLDLTNSANSYSGNTAVNGGTTLSISNVGELGTGYLQLGDSTTTGTLNVTNPITFANTIVMGQGGGIVNTNNWNVTISGDVTGFGGLTKLGQGTLTLTGVDGPGGATVGDGTLVVNGSLQGDVGVSSGARLSGTGSVLGMTNVAAGGTLAPGANGLGTLTVKGNLTLASESSYVITATPTSNGLTQIDGSATLGGTLVVTPTGTFAYNQQIDLITATSGVSGTFQAFVVNGSFGAGLIPILSYNADDALITLRAISISQLLPAGAPVNVINVAGAVDSAIEHDSAFAAFSPLTTLSGAQLEHALSQLNGEVGVEAAQSAFDLGAQFMDVLTEHPGAQASGLATARLTQVAFAGPASDTPLETAPVDTIKLWGTAYGRWDHLGGDALNLGTHTLDDRNDGFAAGADYQLDNTATIGVAAGTGWTSWLVDGDLGQGAANAIQFGVYGSKRIDDFTFSAAASYAHFDTTTNRIVTFTGPDAYRAHFNPQSEAVELDTARRFALDDDLWLSPFVQFRGQFFQTPAYNEATVSGATFYALSYAAKSQSDISHDLGLALDYRWLAEDAPPLDLNLQAGWVHQYAGDLDNQVSFSSYAATNFIAYGTRGPKNAARLAVGGSTAVADQLSLDIEAVTLLSGSSQSYGGNATLTYRW